MSELILCKIDVTKISKERLFVGKSGKYLDAILMENREPDKYGNKFMIVESLSKEERQSGQKGKIIRNAKRLHSKAPASPAHSTHPVNQPAPTNDDDVPF